MSGITAVAKERCVSVLQFIDPRVEILLMPSVLMASQ